MWCDINFKLHSARGTATMKIGGFVFVLLATMRIK